jgi:hypothetical protein
LEILTVNRLRTLSLISIILTSLFIAGGFLSGEAYGMSAGCLGIGVIWAIAIDRRWKIIHLVCFVFFTALTVYGTWREYGILLFLIGFIFNIAAWDLSDFRARVATIQEEAIIDTTFNQHYLYLILALSLGLIVSLLALNIQLQISFIGVLLLGLLMIFSLRTLMRIGNWDN